MEIVDIDHDKLVDTDEIEISEKILELQLREKKAKSQERMAWVALISMVSLITIILTPIISIEKLKVLSDLFGLYFISVVGIIASYYGVSTWMSNNGLNSANAETMIKYNYTGSKKIPNL